METGFESTLRSFWDTNPGNRWYFPFPMGVFGTLRQGWSNSRLMGSRQPSVCHCQYKEHYKAFLADFVAIGLTIHYEEGATAPFEIFVYDALQWDKMIDPVDRLEGFTPQKGGWHYHRTLAFLSVLPADFSHPHFDKKNKWNERRDLEIPVNMWNQYPSIPCWIYSGLEENKKSIRSSRTPIAWDDENFKDI